MEIKHSLHANNTTLAPKDCKVGEFYQGGVVKVIYLAVLARSTNELFFVQLRNPIPLVLTLAEMGSMDLTHLPNHKAELTS